MSQTNNSLKGAPHMYCIKACAACTRKPDRVDTSESPCCMAKAFVAEKPLAFSSSRYLSKKAL